MKNIQYTEVRAKDIESILVGIEQAMVGNKKSHCVIACISMAFLVQDPDISTEALTAGVKQVTELMALHISAKDDKGVTH